MKADTGISTSAIADGSQVLAHDGYDVEAFAQATEDFGRLRRTVEESGATLGTAPALMRDLFWGFHKHAPRIASITTLNPAYELNQQIVGQVLATSEWQELRASGTVGDPLNSALATLGVSARTIAALGEETIRQANLLNELSGEIEQLYAQAESLEELATQVPGSPRSAKLQQQAEQARTTAQEKTAQVEQVQGQLSAGSEKREQQVRQAARQGLVGALQEIEQANDAIKAFGGGAGEGWGTYDGTASRDALSVKEKLTLAKRVGKSAKLQQIAAIAGRFKRIAWQQQRTKVEHPPDEITSVTLGNQLARVLPSELALLAEPQLEDLFYLKYAEASLAQYDLIGHEPQGQGPIILAIDESGSMTADYGGVTGEVWSKAVLLALLSIARMQQRDFAVLHFSGSNNLKVERFPKGTATPAQTISCASHFFGGGTVFEPWMEQALALVDEAAFEKADVICISDGIAAVAESAQSEWQKKRAERKTRVYGILIGTTQGEDVLGQLTDAVFCLADLRADLPALEAIFSV